MAISVLNYAGFRNLEDSSIKLNPNLNFVIGKNGSGKSSLLETIFFLGHGKSFRTAYTKQIVYNESSRFVVSAKFDSGRVIGVSHDIEGNRAFKLDGEKQNSLVELVKNLAVQIVTPESFRLFFGGPKERRKFVDLGMFHVKHQFSDVWKVFNRTLKQRNALLKSKKGVEHLDYWTNEFCQHADLIADLRSKYVSDLSDELKLWIARLLPDLSRDITTQYYQGWSQKKSLLDSLNESRAKELEKGFSLYGPQKFDVRFLVDKAPIEQMLSRGQQKLFLLALTFAQSKLIEKVERVKPILMIDDISAELDSEARKKMFEGIEFLNVQSIVTAIDKTTIDKLVSEQDNYQMFHVEHGKISLV